MLGNKMDFSSCAIWISFYKSSHINYDYANLSGPLCSGGQVEAVVIEAVYDLCHI